MNLKTRCHCCRTKYVRRTVGSEDSLPFLRKSVHPFEEMLVLFECLVTVNIVFLCCVVGRVGDYEINARGRHFPKNRKRFTHCYEGAWASPMRTRFERGLYAFEVLSAPFARGLGQCVLLGLWFFLRHKCMLGEGCCRRPLWIAESGTDRNMHERILNFEEL